MKCNSSNIGVSPSKTSNMNSLRKDINDTLSQRINKWSPIKANEGSTKIVSESDNGQDESDKTKI